MRGRERHMVSGWEVPCDSNSFTPDREGQARILSQLDQEPTSLDQRSGPFVRCSHYSPPKLQKPPNLIFRRSFNEI